MRRSTVFLLLLSAGVAQARTVTIDVPFNPAEVAWFSVQGANAVHGSAVMRTVGGEVRTCAGLDANIVPDSTYARARMQAMYGNIERGLLSARTSLRLEKPDPAYHQTSRTVTCDPQGYFKFSGLPDGSYYVTARIVWGVPGPYFTMAQGGYLMQHVSLHGGETRDIVLSQ